MDTRHILRRARRAGLDVSLTRGNHYVIRSAGERITTLASTPSDYRSTRNALAALKRAGFDLRAR